jgi:hypothetical protein
MTIADHADWEQATRRQRQLAVAADAELRRRHPGQPWPPLHSAEPQAATQPQDDTAIALAQTMDATRERISDLAAQHREFADRLGSRQSQLIPAEDPGSGPTPEIAVVGAHVCRGGQESQSV